jgi:hypothetical protein
MRVSSFAVARPNYYDRNATSSLQKYSAVLAPAVNTVRWTVTISAGTKAFIELGFSSTRRITVGTVAGEYGAYMRLTSGAVYVDFPTISTISNVLDAFTVSQFTSQPTLYAGETLSGSTYDGTTGGTVQHSVAAKLTIFDA